MSRVTVKYKPYARNNGTIVYNLAHNGETCDIDSGLKLKSGEWDSIISRIVCVEHDKEREQYLRNVGFQIESDLKSISLIMRDLEQRDYDYPVNRVARAFRGGASTSTLRQMLERYMTHLSDEVKRTDRYVSAVNAMLKFRGEDDMPLADITQDFVNKFKQSLMDRRLSRYTLSTYLAALSSIYNKAVEWGLAADTRPFGTEPSKLANLYPQDGKQTFREYLPKLQALDLSSSAQLTLARDILLVAHATGLSIRKLGTLTRATAPGGGYECLNANGDALEAVAATPALTAFVGRYADPSACGYLVPLFTKQDTALKGRSQVRYYEAIVRSHLRPLFARLASLLNYPGTLTLAAALGQKHRTETSESIGS